MPKFRKKPVVIEAVQWTGGNHRDMYDFLSDEKGYLKTEGRHFYIDHSKVEGGLVIRTLEGEVSTNIGEWVIKGTKGEFYPCKLDIFEEVYEIAEESDEKHPIQPLYIDDHGTIRFKENKIVNYLLDNGGIDLNQLGRMDFTQNDSEQFSQLIGYSLIGFGELDHVSDEAYEAAENSKYFIKQ